MPTLKIPTPLRSYTNGQTEISVQGGTVGAVMTDLVIQYPALRPHLFNGKDELRPFVNLFLNEDNIKDLDYAAQLARQTEALAREKRAENLKAFTDLGQKWRAMGGAQDDLIRVFHTTTRKLFQKAGYGCSDLPDALEIAREMRKRCKECLSNPSSYEIWADY